MTSPREKIRNNIATRVALEGLELFDTGVQALIDAQTRDLGNSRHAIVNPHTQQTLQRHGSSRLSLDSDELLIDGEDGLDVLAQGVDLELELEKFEQELAELEEADALDEFEITDISTDMDPGPPGSNLGSTYRIEEESMGAKNHTLLDAVLPSWDELDGPLADTLNEINAEEDVLMGALLVGLAEEVAHMPAPYSQVPASRNKPSKCGLCSTMRLKRDL
ncbi:hypothetical protein RHS03_09482, partial [Rhizoctonia solani]